MKSNLTGQKKIIKKPTNEEIKNAIKRIISTCDLNVITRIQVREELSRIFGVDITTKREFINNTIEEILAVQ
jgi:chitin synthase